MNFKAMILSKALITNGISDRFLSFMNGPNLDIQWMIVFTNFFLQVLTEANSDLMVLILFIFPTALDSQKSKAEDKLRDEIRTLHEAYQFLR